MKELAGVSWLQGLFRGIEMKVVDQRVCSGKCLVSGERRDARSMIRRRPS